MRLLISFLSCLISPQIPIHSRGKSSTFQALPLPFLGSRTTGSLKALSGSSLGPPMASCDVRVAEVAADGAGSLGESQPVEANGGCMYTYSYVEVYFYLFLNIYYLFTFLAIYWSIYFAIYTCESTSCIYNYIYIFIHIHDSSGFSDQRMTWAAGSPGRSNWSQGWWFMYMWTYYPFGPSILTVSIHSLYSLMFFFRHMDEWLKQFQKGKRPTWFCWLTICSFLYYKHQP